MFEFMVFIIICLIITSTTSVNIDTIHPFLCPEGPPLSELQLPLRQLGQCPEESHGEPRGQFLYFLSFKDHSSELFGVQCLKIVASYNILSRFIAICSGVSQSLLLPFPCRQKLTVMFLHVTLYSILKTTYFANIQYMLKRFRYKL